MKAHPELQEFLSSYAPTIQQLAIELRTFITELVPEANELIWDNYNALAIAYSKSEKLKDAFCHIALYSKHVNFGFNRGAELSESAVQLVGKGKLIRHLSVTDFAAFPKEEITKMVWEAVGISESLNAQLADKKDLGKSLVMSRSEKKIRPQAPSQ